MSPLGLEPRTKRLKVSCSNQLSYGPGRWIPPCPVLVYPPAFKLEGVRKTRCPLGAQSILSRETMSRDTPHSRSLGDHPKAAIRRPP